METVCVCAPSTRLSERVGSKTIEATVEPDALERGGGGLKHSVDARIVARGPLQRKEMTMSTTCALNTYDDADVLTEEVPAHGDELADKTITLGWGTRRDERRWVNNPFTGETFVMRFAKPERGPKDGSCFLQGETVGEQRLNKNMRKNFLIVLDHDNGETTEDILARVRETGFAAIVYNTHSHLSTESEIPQDKLDKFITKHGLQEYGLEDVAARYLREVKGYVDNLVETITDVRLDHRAGGVKYIVAHAPMHKVRSIFFLDEPFQFAVPGVSQADRMDEWKRRHKGFAEYILRVKTDESTHDCARLMYFYRIPRDADPSLYVSEFIPGNTVTLAQFPEFQEEKSPRQLAREAGALLGDFDHQGTGIVEFQTPNLRRFLGDKRSKTFQASDFMAHYTDARADRGEGKAEYECPHDALHTNAGDPNDKGFFAVNADASLEPPQAWHMGCAHATCKTHTEGDRALYLDQACVNFGISDAMELLGFCTDRSARIEGEVRLRASGISDVDAAIAAVTKTTPPQEVEIIARAIANAGGSAITVEHRCHELATKSGRGRNSIRAAVRGFQRDGAPDAPEDVGELAEFNRQFCMAAPGPHPVIYQKARTPGDEPKVYSYEGFRKIRANDGGLFERWTEWEGREFFEHVVFDPSGQTPRAFNLWTGFPFKGVEGDWSLYRRHIFTDICQGNVEHFRFLICWLADIFQDPGAKKGSAVILKSKAKGTGKGHLAGCIARLLGPYSGAEISKPEQITGRFNSVLERRLFQACDEATYAGNYGDDAALKNAITQPTLIIERKGIDPITVANYTRFMFLTNKDWVVRVDGSDERRYFVLEVSDANSSNKSGARDHWRPLIELMGGSGAPTPGLLAMLYDLEHLSIPDDVDLFNPPHTAALYEQVAESLPVEARWWQAVLRSGEIERVSEPPGPFLPFTPMGALDEIRIDDLHAALVAYAKRVGAPGRAPNESHLGRFLKKMGVNGVKQTAATGGRMYSFPTLEVAREKFRDEFGIGVETDDVEATPPTGPGLSAWRTWGLGEGPRP